MTKRAVQGEGAALAATGAAKKSEALANSEKNRAESLAELAKRSAAGELVERKKAESALEVADYRLSTSLVSRAMDRLKAGLHGTFSQSTLNTNSTRTTRPQPALSVQESARVGVRACLA